MCCVRWAQWTLDEECAGKSSAGRWWWKWSRGFDGRWCQQLCSALVLCCCAAVLCCVLLCIGCQQVAAQAKAEQTSIQAYKHTSIPPALPDHYSLLVLVNMRRYTQKQKHAYIYTNSTHTHTYTNVCGSQKQEWAFISPYENLYCTTCTHLETKQHTSLPPSLPNRFLTFDCTFEYVYVFAFTLFKKS